MQRRRGGRRLLAAVRRAGAAVLALSLLAGIVGVQAPEAQAATVYELSGNWASGTPDTVRSNDNLVSVWRFNLNDDGPAPTNDPVDNVTVAFSVQNGKFTLIPSVCLTEGVDPVSAISADGLTLTCNVGTRDQGTAELMLTGLQADGMTGDLVFVSAEIGGVSADLPLIPIENPFLMDMKFDSGTPASLRNGELQTVVFPWSLRHSPGAEAGPDSVSYTLQFSSTAGNIVTPLPAGCTVQNRTHTDHPNSGSGYPADRTAPFPATCTLTSIGTNQVRLTLSGIDYSKTLLPTRDSRGNALPTGWDVIAAGNIQLQFTYTDGTQTSFVASAPTYTSVIGRTSVDDTSNNTNFVASSRGSWTGGWLLNRQVPSVPGTQWTDTFRTMAGQPALAISGVRPPLPGATQGTQVCSILDVKYVDVVDAVMGTISGGVVTPYAGITYWYYTGNGTSNNMNPSHANYNPNTFTCEGTGAGWTTTKPANMSTVRAVKAIVSPAAGANISDSVASLYVTTRIKDDVQVGQDIWVWTSYVLAGGSTPWANPHRSLNVADKPASGVLTPNSRYPFTGGGRDVMRIVSATPKVTKIIDQRETLPGATVNYTVTHRAESSIDAPVPSFTLTDVLPAGMEYVVGSASIPPTSVSGQTLAWNLAGIDTNTEYTLSYSARVPSDAEPGDTFTNGVTATIGETSATSRAETRVRDGGYTMLTKTAEQVTVPHDGGTAEGSWVVRITSLDTVRQTFTDAIDILPYNGDGRGTSFNGSYRLSAPVQVVAGATAYYTSADPATLHDDPAHASNGSAGDISGNTVGWSTTFDASATAVRVIGPALLPSTAQEFGVTVITTGAKHEDVYVNRAEARASRTQLAMRTSSRFEIGAVNSVALKKYVQDAAGEWRDAQDVDDYPEFRNGDTVSYRLVVTNTGDETLTNLQLADDRVDLAALDPLPTGLDTGAVIPELRPGESNALTFEYEVALSGHAPNHLLVNNACVEADDPVEPSCDPAGLRVLPSTLSWEKVSAGSHRLAGSEWELTPVDENDEPTGDPIAVADCIEAAAENCDGADVDREAGRFTVDPLTDGRYRLVETRAPAGYRLDPTPRFIEVLGETGFDAPIVNEQQEGPSLPLTGGVGALGFWCGAAALGALAAAGLLRQRRRSRIG